MTSMESVWASMKTAATAYARQRTILTMPASRLTVLRISGQKKAQTPSQDALHYLATELVRLTLEKQYPANDSS
jgi:hypothetical protein